MDNILYYRKVTVNRGFKIQIYQTNHELVHTFSSVIEATRENEYVSGCTVRMIKTAIENGGEYKKYLWKNLDRVLPDDTVQIFPEVIEQVVEKKNKTSNIGFVAMLNPLKTKIEKVFQNIRSATEYCHFTSSSPISRAIAKGSKSAGQYFMMWENCDQSMKDEFLSRNKLPEKAKHANSKDNIIKHDQTTNAILQEYVCIDDVIKEIKCTRTTLKKAIENNSVCNGFKWSFKK